MNISSEIKSLLAWKGKQKSQLLEKLNVRSAQAMSTKFSRNSWSAADLIKVAAFLGGDLIIRVDGREIKLTEKHIENLSQTQSRNNHGGKVESRIDERDTLN